MNDSDNETSSSPLSQSTQDADDADADADYDPWLFTRHGMGLLLCDLGQRALKPYLVDPAVFSEHARLAHDKEHHHIGYYMMKGLRLDAPAPRQFARLLRRLHAPHVGLTIATMIGRIDTAIQSFQLRRCDYDYMEYARWLVIKLRAAVWDAFDYGNTLPHFTINKTTTTTT